MRKSVLSVIAVAASVLSGCGGVEDAQQPPLARERQALSGLEISARQPEFFEGSFVSELGSLTFVSKWT